MKTDEQHVVALIGLLKMAAELGPRAPEDQGSWATDKAHNPRTQYAETAGNPQWPSVQSIDLPGDDLLQLTRHYAQRVAEGVDLPSWADRSFSSAELSVLGAIRDTAYNNSEDVCSLSVSEIARLVGVRTRTAATFEQSLWRLRLASSSATATISLIAAFNTRLDERQRSYAAFYLPWQCPRRFSISSLSRPTPHVSNVNAYQQTGCLIDLSRPHCYFARFQCQGFGRNANLPAAQRSNYKFGYRKIDLEVGRGGGLKDPGQTLRRDI